MDEDTITDLKQFITVTMNQQTATLRDELGRKIDDAKEEILAAVADTMQNHIDSTDERFDNHEQRIKRLEHKAA